MDEKEIVNLRAEEKKLLALREEHKKVIHELTRKIYNIHQKINYFEKTKNDTPNSFIYQTFGKKKKDLSVDELREYNRIMRSKRLKKCK